ncbi:Acyl-CoA N-acyltransferases (Nat) [Glarea lozoyensis ATCC 20868]|uniref:Acyl-CoA N-acyltransferases (Nat) n=1 Tax=Glarea lozoyensis (strain ATCC 20868 / MF5171) TaxID=1116229 RepID=S3DCH3_GLAL2|nr:Acyl-CoA N-acyltransferases (Nat) [Glarea lozoyensis ATCC 20868]EPE36122.1 Acyl-CoA N-acyltransferases (Nat) [Glarea lozoyensis ATCC 20868]
MPGILSDDHLRAELLAETLLNLGKGGMETSRWAPASHKKYGLPVGRISYMDPKSYQSFRSSASPPSNPTAPNTPIASIEHATTAIKIEAPGSASDDDVEHLSLHDIKLLSGGKGLSSSSWATPGLKQPTLNRPAQTRTTSSWMNPLSQNFVPASSSRHDSVAEDDRSSSESSNMKTSSPHAGYVTKGDALTAKAASHKEPSCVDRSNHSRPHNKSTQMSSDSKSSQLAIESVMDASYTPTYEEICNRESPWYKPPHMRSITDCPKPATKSSMDPNHTPTYEEMCDRASPWYKPPHMRPKAPVKAMDKVDREAHANSSSSSSSSDFSSDSGIIVTTLPSCIREVQQSDRLEESLAVERASPKHHATVTEHARSKNAGEPGVPSGPEVPYVLPHLRTTESHVKTKKPDSPAVAQYTPSLSSVNASSGGAPVQSGTKAEQLPVKKFDINHCPVVEHTTRQESIDSGRLTKSDKSSTTPAASKLASQNDFMRASAARPKQAAYRSSSPKAAGNSGFSPRFTNASINPLWTTTTDAKSFIAAVKAKEVLQPKSAQRYYRKQDEGNGNSPVKSSCDEASTGRAPSKERNIRASSPKAAESSHLGTAITEDNTSRRANAQADLSYEQRILLEMTEIENLKPSTNGKLLTKDTLQAIDDVAPRSSASSVAAFPSNFGDRGSDNDRAKEGVRARQGRDGELLDWDDKMMPPPCDWERDRPKFDSSSYLSEYILEWCPKLVDDRIDTTAKVFASEIILNNIEVYVAYPIENLHFVCPPKDTGGTIPDLEASEDKTKQMIHTAQMAIDRRMTQLASKLKHERKARKHAEMVEREMQNQIDLPNPFAPKIDVYLRPATVGDAQQVAHIYNHYVMNSHITEDQEPVSTDEVANVIQASQRERLPFIVAILGNVPESYTRQHKTKRSQRATLSEYEEVVGFASAEIFNFGWGGSRKGRSRATANLQLYVSPEHLRHGIGRNLLDRLMFTLKSTYPFMDACAWLNPDGEKTYDVGGAGKWHQLMFQLPILKKDDPNLGWVTTFLKNHFFFNLEGIQRSLGRTAADRGIPVFTDTAIFQAEALQEEEYFDITS